MAAESVPNTDVVQLLETAKVASLAGDYTYSIWNLAHAVLAQHGVEPPKGYKPWTFHQNVPPPDMVTEMAIPGSAFSDDVQRVRVASFRTGGNRKLPGIQIGERFPIGGIGAVLVGNGQHPHFTMEDFLEYDTENRGLITVNVDQRSFASAASGRDLRSERDIYRVVGLAATVGVATTPKSYDRRTLRNIVQTASTFMSLSPSGYVPHL